MMTKMPKEHVTVCGALVVHLLCFLISMGGLMLMNPKLVLTLPGVEIGIGGAFGGQVTVETETNQRLSYLSII